MKKSTCKIFIGIAIIWVLIASLLLTLLDIEYLKSFPVFISLFLIQLLIFGIPAWIFLIIGITKWNSEKEKAETLKSRAKVHIHVKGKMKDL